MLAEALSRPHYVEMKVCLAILQLSVIFTVSLFAETGLLAPILSPFVETGELAGAVALVTNAEKTTSLTAIGFADREAKRAMAPDTLFWIASQSKPMTVVAVMMLVDEGKISLDDPIEQYLPEFHGQLVIVEREETRRVLAKPRRPITLRDCLSHMSGLPFKSAAEVPTLDRLPLAVAVRTYAMTPLENEPGTAYQYSNAGINIAGRLVEVISEQSYEEFMQERLFNPLGMTDTTFWPNEEQLSRLAISYRPNADKTALEPFPISQLLYPLSDRARRYPMPAGGLFSSAEDTARFCRLLLNRGVVDGRRYLSESSFEELTKRQTPSSVEKSYGLGFAVADDSFGHGGAHATNMEVYPDKGIALVWMVQHAGFLGNGKEAQERFKSHLLNSTPSR